jgi:hypothetical protein
VGDANPTSLTYPYTVQGTPGTCVTQDNTATFTTNTSGTTGSASQTVKECTSASPRAADRDSPRGGFSVSLNRLDSSRVASYSEFSDDRG